MKVVPKFFACTTLISLGLLSACSGGGGGNVDLSANEYGSEPINDKEAIRYKKALLKCYKTGGQRVVKIEGRLRCY